MSGAWALVDPAHSSSGSSQNSRNICRAKRPAQECQYHNAIQALSSEGNVSQIGEVLKEMLMKHLQAPQSMLREGLTPTPVILCEFIVPKCVSFFSKGSAPGPSGLLPSHLKQAIR